MGMDRVVLRDAWGQRLGAGAGALLVAAWALAGIVGPARAQDGFSYAGEPVHPSCIQALVMHQGDRSPVTTAVSLEGCEASDRSKVPVRHEGDLLVIEDDDALPGGGSFGYQVINRLENGIFGLAIRRVDADGKERVSLAAVQMAPRAMLRNSKIRNVMMVELLGELWVPDIELASFRSVGNKVHFISGVGPNRVERNVDFTRLGKLRR